MRQTWHWWSPKTHTKGGTVADASSEPAGVAVDGRPRVVVLLSGVGSTMAALVEATREPGYPAQVVAVGSDRPGAGGLAFARDADIATFVVAPADHADRRAWSAALAEAVAEHEPDLVLSAGLMRILDPVFVDRFAPRLINSHPSLLPCFPGAHAVADALAYGVRVTGATVHVMDAGVDSGPIVAQTAVEVVEGDDVASLHERIKVAERRMLIEVVATMAGAQVHVDGRKVSLT